MPTLDCYQKGAHHAVLLPPTGSPDSISTSLDTKIGGELRKEEEEQKFFTKHNLFGAEEMFRM